MRRRIRPREILRLRVGVSFVELRLAFGRPLQWSGKDSGCDQVSRGFAPPSWRQAPGAGKEMVAHRHASGRRANQHNQQRQYRVDIYRAEFACLHAVNQYRPKLGQQRHNPLEEIFLEQPADRRRRKALEQVRLVPEQTRQLRLGGKNLEIGIQEREQFLPRIRRPAKRRMERIRDRQKCAMNYPDKQLLFALKVVVKKRLVDCRNFRDFVHARACESPTWVRVGIPETFAANIAVGEKIRVQFPGGRTVDGTVICKSVEGDFASQYDLNQVTRDIRSVSIKIAVPNPDLTITPGMSARVVLTPEQLKPAAPPPNIIVSRQAT